MPSFAKPILLSLAGALGLYGLGVLFANMYLQSRGVQGRIRNAVTEASGLPVTINRTYYTPWSGLAISGVAVPPIHPEMDSPLVEIESVRVSLSLFALLDGRIHIRNIILDNPRIVSRQQRDGSWTFDEHPAIAGTQPTQPTLTTPIAPSNPAPTPSHQPAPLPPKPHLVIDSFHIKNGSAVFYMADGTPGLELSDVSLESYIPAQAPAQGTFHAKSATLGGVIKPTSLHGSFTWEKSRLLLPNISATLGGGMIGAVFELSSGASTTFTTNVTASDISLSSLVSDAGFDPAGTEGLVSGNFTLAGSPGQEATYTGNAHLRCASARMIPIDPIRQLGDMFQIKELQALEIDDARANLTIADGKIRVDDITLATDNVILDAQGDSTFDGALALDARFHVSDRLRRKTGGILGKKFATSDTPGFSHMPFSITGTIHRPKTDLLDKIVGVRIQQDLGGLLRNFLQFPANKGKSKKTQPLASPKPGS